MASDVLNLKYLPLIEDLSLVGEYVWGAPILSHLMSFLPSHSGSPLKIAGFTLFLPMTPSFSYFFQGGLFSELTHLALLYRFKATSTSLSVLGK